MERDQEFLARWAQDEPIYRAFGSYIVEAVMNAVALRQQMSVDLFFKVPPGYRLKEGQSLLEKAFYRGKEYVDAYRDITDKVGTRFVALLGRDLAIIENALEAIPDLDVSKDRDYEQEQKANPVAFDYAAKHYVVRPSKDLKLDALLVPTGTPCEVQIKTVLQHAYSELSHDTIYKPQIQRTATMQRNAAKAQALLEATNDYFEKVDDEVAAALASVRAMTAELGALYRELIRIAPQPSVLEGVFLNSYERKAGDNYVEAIREMIAEKDFLPKVIRDRAGESNPIFRQPAILLVYLDIYRRKERALQDWPLTPVEMEPLLNDFGQSAEA